MTLKSYAQLFGSLAALALLSACASKPQLSAQQESSDYLSRARGNYTAPGPASDPWGPYVVEAAAKYDVPERWIREVMRQESGGKLFGRSGNLITSGAGAMGLMQVMPATYDDLRGRYPELGQDPYDPHNNIMAGAAYIREMYDIYGSPGFLAAYNAGPGRLDDYLTRNRTLPEETRRYVASIGPRISGYSPTRGSPGEQYAMNAMPFTIPEGPRYSRNTGGYSNSPAPIQLAQRQVPAPSAPAPFIRLQPQVQLAQLPEPPRVEAPRFEPPRNEVRTPIVLSPPPARVETAQLIQPLPEPPRYAPPRSEPYRSETYRSEPSRPAAPSPGERQQFAAMLVRNSPTRSPFALVSPANAEPIGIRRGAPFSPGGWAVQVGAFANEGQAAAATLSARDQARDVLGRARTTVASVRQPRGVLYRARLTGLSRDAAAAACERLARSRTSCMVVSPDAQS